MEPVAIEVRIRNLTGLPLTIDPRLAPEYGAIAFFINRVGGPVQEFHPLLCYLAEAETKILQPAIPGNEGTDRYSQLVSLVYGKDGFYFDRPGEYLIRAVYQSHGDILQPSNVLKIRIGFPQNRKQEEIASDFFSQEVGLSLYLGGSKSPFLSKGMDLLAEIHQREPDSRLGAQLAQTLARSETRSFHRLEKNKMKLVHKSDPKKALQLTESAAKRLATDKNQHSNLRQDELTRIRVESLEQLNETKRAGEEWTILQQSLARRGVHAPVLQAIEKRAKQFAPSSAVRKRRSVKRKWYRFALKQQCREVLLRGLGLLSCGGMLFLRRNMPQVSIHFQDGFEDDTAEVWSGSSRVLKREHLKTSKLIGLADTAPVDLPDGDVKLEIRVPTRNIKHALTLDTRDVQNVGISLDSRQLNIALSKTPFGYA